jgi:uncharacterized protein YunC (DUF1805 family)
MVKRCHCLLVTALFTLFLIGVPCLVKAQDNTPGISRVVELKEIRLAKGTAAGITIMRNSELPAAILIKAAQGFAVCAHFNLTAMQEHGIAAVMFTGVKSIEEAVDAKVVDLTSQAKNLGIKKGMSIKEALEMMM